jgi:hypothetical protein
VNRGRPRYLSYLLRLWQTQGEGHTAWRASLESSQTGKRTGFSSLDALFAFIERETCRGQAHSDDVGPVAGHGGR